MSTRKKPFKEKFQKVGNEWKPKGPAGGWQTLKGVELPPKGEPWLANLRMWVSEMNQWAEVVNEELHELRDELESLKANAPPVSAPEPAPSSR
jgi:hypothetical protein